MAASRTLGSLGVIMVLSLASTNPANSQETTQDARQFVADHEKNIKPLEIEIGRAWWNANVSGKDEDFAAKEQAENKLNDALADKQQFARLKKIHDGKLSDAVLKREMDVLYLQYLEKQVDPSLLKRMTSKANTIEKAFNVFRAKVSDKEYTDGEVRRVLQKSKDAAERKQVWEASKQVG